jgi:hypothetical protein
MREKTKRVLQEELQSLADRIKANHKNAGQVASGKTLRSIHVDVTDKEGALFGRAYFGVLETGRRAGRVPRNFTGIILQWMKDKGVHADPIPYKRKPSAGWSPKYTAQERGDYSLAGAIATRIRKEGSKLYRDGGRTDIFSNEIPTTTKNILDRLVTIMKENITSETLTHIKQSKQ